MHMPPTHSSRQFDRLTVIIVTYNSAHCLQEQSANLSGIANIVVVDNNSHDDTVASARRLLPQATIIENTANLGFGAANNLALRQTKTPFALLLNPDCIISPAALAQLLASASRHPESAIIAPQIVDGNGRRELNYRWPKFTWKPNGPAAEGPCCVGFACGACLLINMTHLQKLGMFDEAFFLYYEDDDLCTRAFLQKFPIVLDPAAVALHASRGSVRGRSRWDSEYLRGYHHAQSKLLYTEKYRGISSAKALRWRVAAAAVILLPFRVLFFSPPLIGRLAGRIAGLWSYQKTSEPHDE